MINNIYDQYYVRNRYIITRFKGPRPRFLSSSATRQRIQREGDEGRLTSLGVAEPVLEAGGGVGESGSAASLAA